MKQKRPCEVQWGDCCGNASVTKNLNKLMTRVDRECMIHWLCKDERPVLVGSPVFDGTLPLLFHVLRA